MASAAQQLFNAARDGNLAEVERLLSENAPIDDFGAGGDTPFLIAFKNKHYDVAQRLAEAGADVNRINSYSATPLLCQLAEDNDIEGVTRFLELPRVNPNVYDAEAYSRTPLIIAVLKSHVEVVRMLLDAGANVNKEDSDGRTAYDIITNRISRHNLSTSNRNRDSDHKLYMLLAPIVAIQDDNAGTFMTLLQEGAEITSRMRKDAAAKPVFASILALEGLIYTEPLPMGMKPNNVWARAREGESLNSIRANLEARRAANAASVISNTRRRKAPRRKTQRRRKSRRSIRK